MGAKHRADLTRYTPTCKRRDSYIDAKKFKGQAKIKDREQSITEIPLDYTAAALRTGPIAIAITRFESALIMSGRKATSGSGGTEPDVKRRKLLDAGGPIEDDETARQKMREARVYKRGVEGTPRNYDGFDPDNVADVKSYDAYDYDGESKYNIKPMGYFAKKGDLPMMRWLYVNGADTRDVDVAKFFPMYRAALRGQLDVCKWLFQHGAAGDVKRRTRDYVELFVDQGELPGRSPLSSTFGRSTRRDVSRWLILNGALCKDDDSGKLDAAIIKQDLGGTWHGKERKLLLEWATDLHRARSSFLLFLSGALSAPKHAYRTRQSSSPLRILSGKSGALELISDYTGIVNGCEARIIRQLTEMMPYMYWIEHFEDDMFY